MKLPRRRRRRPEETTADADLSDRPSAAADEEGASTPAEPEGGTDEATEIPSPGSGAEGGPSTEGESAEGGLISETHAAMKSVRKRHLLVAGMGLMAAGFVGVLLFSAFSMWWTSQPSFCDRCHVMNEYVDTWDQSAHTGINCEHCHINPGLFSFLGGKIAGLQVVANYITGHYEDYSFNASVTNAACLECHEEILDKNVRDVSSGIRVSHAHIIEGGGKCMSCHSTVAHGDAVSIGSATYPTMQTCLVCHDDVTAPLSDCGLCHITPPIGQMPE
jgi:nitrate/TMAO reductase-like tetraheme cytochrome c subunit